MIEFPQKNFNRNCDYLKKSKENFRLKVKIILPLERINIDASNALESARLWFVADIFNGKPP